MFPVTGLKELHWDREGRQVVMKLKTSSLITFYFPVKVKRIILACLQGEYVFFEFSDHYMDCLECADHLRPGTLILFAIVIIMPSWSSVSQSLRPPRVNKLPAPRLHLCLRGACWPCHRLIEKRKATQPCHPQQEGGWVQFNIRKHLPPSEGPISVLLFPAPSVSRMNQSTHRHTSDTSGPCAADSLFYRWLVTFTRVE